MQEDILDEFLNKLKCQIKKLRQGPPDDKLTDISFPINTNTLDQLNNMIKTAALLGIQVYRPENALEKFQPTIFIGELVYNNNAILPNECTDFPYATIMSFRNLAEAITLANNCRQNLAASVWTENIGTANEVAVNLKVNHVWINSYGMFSSNLNCLSPCRSNTFCEGK